ncbi:MAG: CrcB family protein [Flavobacteriales bacterium]|nr:CrcB family protein [Flavobacteriales bacterium]
MNTWLAVFLGGGAGSVLRYAISRGMLAWVVRTSFPWATLLTNLLATALLAFVILRWQVHQPGREHWQALLAIGFCGGFSTMSTFNHENYVLFRDGLYGFALVNILISVTVGLLLFFFFARSS